MFGPIRWNLSNSTHPSSGNSLGSFTKRASGKSGAPQRKFLRDAISGLTNWAATLGSICPTIILKAEKKERLCHATNSLAKNNYTLQEGTYARNINLEEVRHLSETWQSTRQTRRLIHFFYRPLVLTDEPDVRKFFLFNPAGEIVAFVFFDPIYRDGLILGYSPAVKRRLPDAPLRA